jgi:hypothetical protein
MALIGANESLRKNHQRTRAITLQRSEGVKDAGTLLGLYGRMPYFSPARQSLRATLIRLLPRFQASDIPPLAENRRRELVTMLRSTDTDMVVAILQAMEQIGGDEALPSVRALAEEQWSAKRNNAVRQAAQHCLPILQARLQQQNNPQTLLRSTSAPNDTLLRAAEGTPAVEADPQQMLRASQSDPPREP